MASKAAILAVALLAAGAAAWSWAAVEPAVTTSAAAPVQQALAALERNALGEAEEAAAGLAAADTPGAWRGWLIVGAARQRQGRYELAEEAYRQYLSYCPSAEDRAFALAQIDACQSAAKPHKPPLPLARTLTDEERDELGKVEQAEYTESTDHFVVKAFNSPLAKLVARKAERSLGRICKVILSGQEYPHTVSIYVWPDEAEYRRHAPAAPEWAGGSFRLDKGEDGDLARRIDLTQLDVTGRFDPEMIDRVLPHELCHLVTTEFFGDARCPLALHEGLAMLAETGVDNDRVKLAGLALGGERKIALANLLTVTGCKKQQAEVFYAEAFSLASFLRARLTKAQFADLLAHVKTGCALEDALQRAAYAPPDDAFLERLGKAWADDAIQQAQFLQALDTPAAS